MLRARAGGVVWMCFGNLVAAAIALSGACVFDTETTECDRSKLRCPPGFVCAADQNVCILKSSCGDGVVDQQIGEECDDGNLLDGDGCDSNCTIARCGNNIIDIDESCDDGNRTSGDGCSADCHVER